MILFHRTPAWREILGHGFKDRHAYTELLSIQGVWLSDVPLNVNDYGWRGNRGEEVLLEVHLDEALMAEYEIIEEGPKGHREWCVPASVVNQRATIIRVASEYDAFLGEVP